MFGSKNTYLDLAYDLRDRRDWKPAVIRELDYPPDPSVIAVEGGNGLIAVGTRHGRILLFGCLPTTQVLKVPGKREVKHLQFATLVFKLVCIDDSGTLHVWDLTQLGNAKLLASESFGSSVSSLTTSPNHSHAFISTERGVLTYDLLCQVKSPYFIPRVWKNYESNRLKLGTSLDGLEAYPVDVVIHPRNLNLTFVAFSTGIALFDLTDREVKRRYELMIPPGCPGAMGYGDPDLMVPRHPSVTSITVHASGQLFAVGYIDGTIAFWAVDEEERPLQVRTIDNLDINFPDGEKLEEALSTRSRTTAPVAHPEPVFKLSWTTFGAQVSSDPYNCEHILVVLGGLYPGQGSGVTALRFPPLILPSPAADNSRGLDAGARKALSKALTSATKFSYPSAHSSVISDFQLVPKDSSLFNGNWNPEAILTLIEGHGARSIEAWEFPPPSFGIKSEQPQLTSSQSEENKTAALDEELASTFRELTLEQPPQNLTRFLPTQLWIGFHAIREGDIVETATDTYELLLEQNISGVFARDGLGRAGSAWVNYGDQDQARGLASTKRQYHRLLITHHQDLTIRFQDISPQLLIGSMSDPLKTQYPAPLRHLTIHLPQILDDEQVRSVMKTSSPLDVGIQSASLTSESSECCVVLRDGHLFIFRFSPQARNSSRHVDVYDSILNLQTLSGSPNSFQPLVMITNTDGPVERCELADIGFVAISYVNGTLLIINLRGPSVVYKDTGKVTKRLSLAAHLHGSQEERRVCSMKWVICGEGDDSVLRLKLIAAQRSGDTRVLTLSQSSDQQWRVDAKLAKVDGPEKPLSRGIFVMRAGKGGSRGASRVAFRQVVYGESDAVLAKKTGEWDMDAHTFLIACGEKGARCFVNLTGSRVGRVEWGSDHRIEYVQVVERNGANALVAITEDREVFVYSIPSLEVIQSFQLTKKPASLNVICIDETGDFIDWTYDEKSDSFTGATLGTLFSMHRVFDEPIIDFAAKRKSAPSLPPPVPLSPVTYLGSWFNFKKGATGDAIDALLAGPERPIPQEAETSTIVNSEWQKQMQSRTQALAAQASAASSNLYTNLSQAMSERGDLLQGVQESANQLEESGRQWMLQAKKMAAAQTGKSWLGL